MRFRLFGEVTARGDEGEVALGSGRPAAVLGLLLLEAGSVVTVDRLAESLWPGDAAASKVHAVRVNVSRVRASLAAAGAGRRVVVSRPGGYVVDAARTDVDVLRFEDLAARIAATGDDDEVLELGEEALDLWRGEPLASYPYDDFAVEARRRLSALRLDVLEAWGGAALGAGRSAAVATLLAAEVGEHPYRERLWAHLATALYREGRQAEALDALRAARSALVGLGLDVTPPLARLEAAILTHDVGLTPPTPGRGTLPAPVDSFVGRASELARIRDAFAASRLVTLTGPGGCGKTRLAVEAARRLEGRFDDVRLVELATVASPDGVAAAMAAALELGPGPQGELVGNLATSLRDRSMLILLDNCEHVIDVAATTAEAVLRRCPTARILATTREPLRIAGETVVVLPSLGTPPPGAPLDAVADAEAVRLFVDRTRSAVPGFALSPGNADDVTAVVRMLDGIPLAIELAAVRVRTLPVAEVARRLQDLLTALGVGSRTALPRHRTLTAALAWSTDLLGEEERAAFCCLGVLRGDFSLEAAAAVTGGSDPGEVEALVAALVEKSLVTVDRDADGAPRYRLLEPVRQFAVRLLEDRGESDEAEARRDEHFAGLAREAGAGSRRWADARWLRRVDRERTNLVVTVESLARRGQPAAAAAMAADLGGYMVQLGLYEEGRRLIDTALDGVVSASTRTRLDLLREALHLAVQHGDVAAAHDHAAAMIELAEQGGSAADLGHALNALGALHAARGDMRAARRALERAIATAAADVVLPATINLAAVAAWSGRPDEARVLAAEALSLGETPQVTEVLRLVDGLAARMSGDPEQALSVLEAAIAAATPSTSRFHHWLAHVEAAEAAAETGDVTASRRHCGHVLDGARTEEVPALSLLRARVVAARIAAGDDDDAAWRLVRRIVQDAEGAGMVGRVVEAADVAGELLLARGDAAGVELLRRATSLRGELHLARDPWQQRRHDELVRSVPGGPAEASAATAGDVTNGVGSLAAAILRAPQAVPTSVSSTDGRRP